MALPGISAGRTFTLADQLWFAALSGDRNPIHVDPVAARRTAAGQPVVHGIHTLLWALEVIRAAHPDMPPPGAIRADFLSFLAVGSAAEVGELSDGRRATVTAGGMPVMRLELRAGGGPAVPVLPVAQEAPAAPETPAMLDLADMAGLRGVVACASTPEVLAAAFPGACAWLGAERVAALTACTRLVGMVCPGLHSIFNRIDVNILPGEDDRLAYEVSAVDPRFRRVTLAVSGGGIVGTLVTSARQPPVTQPSIAELAPRVAPRAFAGAKALVVGGSRGLGELTAKLLAAGGADVLLTYASGRDDAERVTGEIRDWGGSCRSIRYDAAGNPAAQFAGGAITGLTHCYYFATPPIFGASVSAYDKTRFDRFRALYVDGFAALCEALAGGGDMSIYYPSSVAVAERRRGWANMRWPRRRARFCARRLRSGIAACASSPPASPASPPTRPPR
jgi:acyl dehydratase